MIDLSQKTTIEYRQALTFLLIMGALLGLFCYQNLPIISPKDNGEATIKVYYPGASAPEVEKFVTAKIEEELMGVEGYDYSSSVTQRGAALIYLKLGEGPREDKWQQVGERLNILQDSLPQNAQIFFDTEFVEKADILLSIWNEDEKHGPLIEDAKHIKQGLSAIPGLSSLEILGEEIQEIKVQVDQDKLRQHKDLSSKDLVRVLGMSAINTPQSKINVNGVQISLKASKSLNSLEDIANTIIYISQESGRTVRLKDVATITWGAKDTNAIVKHNGEKAILLAGYFKKGQNPGAISKEIDNKLKLLNVNLASQTKTEQILTQSQNDRLLVNFQTESGLTLREKENTAERISQVLKEGFTVLVDQEGLARAWVEADKIHQPAIQIRVAGPQEGLAKIVEETKELLKSTPGILNIQDDQSANRYEYFLDIDYQKAVFLGVSPLDIKETIDLFSRGQIATTLSLGDQEYDVNVEGNLTSIENIMDLAIISTETGQRVFLKQIAELKLQPQVQLIRKYNGQHTVTVSAELQEEANLRETEKLVNNELAKRDLKNYHIAFIKKDQLRTISPLI